MRKQGIYNESLPTKKAKSVTASNFLIAGLIGHFERRYKKAFPVRGPEEMKDIFGDNIYPTYYGWDSALGFFANVVGVDAKLYVKSHVGHTGSAFDGVAASGTLLDGASASCITLEAAYMTELDYSLSGNRTGRTVEIGDRFTTAIKSAGAAADTYIEIDSVAGIKVGDLIKVVATGGGGATVWKKVTEINEGTGRVNFADAFHATASPAIDDVVTVPGFRIRTWRKSLTGVVKEVDEELGKAWCTTESDVVDYFVENVFAKSKWMKADYLAPVTPTATKFPVAVSTVAYLTGGANGTAPTIESHWAADLTAFNNLPVRIVANCETTNEAVQKAIETYNRSRDDNPKTIYNIPEDQAKSQLITIGNKFQRSDDVLGIIVANWLEKNDPFANSTTAPKRKVPNVGFMMGLWIRCIGILGIHQIPAQSSVPVYGCTGVVGYQALDQNDRTDLCEAGINVIQDIPGKGILVKSWYTPSTTKEFMFGNGIMMREFFKVSCKDSLADTENEPNSFDRIKSSRSAEVKFFHKMWESGSTGNVATGETFGQTEDPDTGEKSSETDHYQIQVNVANNPQANIEAGERNLDSWFTYPAPAASIKIGVGLMLLG